MAEKSPREFYLDCVKTAASAGGATPNFEVTLSRADKIWERVQRLEVTEEEPDA